MKEHLRCLVPGADQGICGAPAVFFDSERGELVCQAHAPPDAPRAADLLALGCSALTVGDSLFRRALQAVIRNVRGEEGSC